MFCRIEEFNAFNVIFPYLITCPLSFVRDIYIYIYTLDVG